MNKEYENYGETAIHYDCTRIPIGTDILFEHLRMLPRPLSEQHVLDAGCGTGNYIEVLKGTIGFIYGIELNECMFNQARQKFKDHSTIILDRGNILNLPYKDAMFDCVMFNQVLHHLNGEQSEIDKFPQIHRVFTEAYRVLRNSGILIINTSSHQQLFEGFWWADLIPKAVSKISKRFPSLKQITALLGKVGLTFVETIVPGNAVLQGEGYLDPTGPLRKSYRDGDSTWSLADETELKQALRRLQEMIENGTVNNYIKARESLRNKIGQTTFIIARK